MHSYTRSDRVFHFFNYIAFIIISITMIGPLIHLAAVSLSSSTAVKMKQVTFWPIGLNFNVYQQIVNQESLWRSLGVSVYITLIGTLAALFFTSTLAYALSRPYMKGRAWVLRGIIVTFIFSVPLIPFYMVVKELGLLNSLWALIIPNALGAFNVIIMKTFFQGLSSEILEAGQIDGCSEFGIFTKIALPLSLPSIATIGLFHAVGQWNAYFHALIFIRDKSLYPIQVVLKGMVIDEGAIDTAGGAALLAQAPPEQLMAGIILFATFPILLVYPFIQKHFVKGAMLGALKE